jgi:hypothetical protein
MLGIVSQAVTVSGTPTPQVWLRYRLGSSSGSLV